MRRKDASHIAGARRRALPWAIGSMLWCLSLVVPHCATAKADGRSRFQGGLGACVLAEPYLGVIDIQPATRPRLGITGECGYAPSEDWRLRLAGGWEGTRFSYTSPLQTGRIEDFGWKLRLGVDRLAPMGNRTTGEVGLGLAYGQVRSWLDSGTATEAGPRNVLYGVSWRMAVSHVLGERWHVSADIVGTGYRAHARDDRTSSTYDWFCGGISFGLVVRR